MKNDEGEIVDLYIPRKCSWTNKLITAKDHGSVQINIGHLDEINIGHLDESGVYTNSFSTFALCGQVRVKGEADSALDHLWTKKRSEIGHAEDAAPGRKMAKPSKGAADGGAAPGLTQRLIDNSSRVHKKSNALLLTKVAALFTDRTLYGKAIGCFYLVFVELEAALRKAMDADKHSVIYWFVELEAALRKAMDADKRVGALRPTLEPLWRVPAYEKDLEFYLGKDYAEQIPRNAAIQAYVDRCRQLADSQPLLLLAHAFTQHTAGLSGGRVLKKMARKYMQLPEDQGTAIFEFPGGVELKEAFKERLDEVGRGLSEEETQQILDEQIVAFNHNIAIIQAFRVSWADRIKALFKVVPAANWAAALFAILATGVAVAAVIYGSKK
ncbi:40S ribosomal S21-2 [Chlorella sorokiniana]|uniref:40S ribosomal S21-2 n=1 Tax=Chlorella sorokiniana TaxID=3076 RepID=A0A2P6U2R4_CHLSO|nr:40S ribosomal S21-2 [Chlorella sorokiniana]|eukprot:PRW60607.1 40S ribosomal S21-2 [Chlorella sorokiniana]